MIVGLSNEKKTLDYIEMRENCCIIRHTRMKIAKKKMHYSLKKSRKKCFSSHGKKRGNHRLYTVIPKKMAACARKKSHKKCIP